MTKASRILMGMIFTISLCQADTITTFQVDTTVLFGNIFTPYILDFRLMDGKGTGDANNTVTITNISAGFGSLGSPTLSGGATGNLSSMVKLTDSSAINEFQQGFDPGPGFSLRFTLSLTGNPDSGGVPDKFAFYILDTFDGGRHSRVPSFGPDEALLLANIDSAMPTVQKFVIDPARVPLPEPGTWVLLATGIAYVATRFSLSDRSFRDKLKHAATTEARVP